MMSFPASQQMMNYDDRCYIFERKINLKTEIEAFH